LRSIWSCMRRDGYGCVCEEWWLRPCEGGKERGKQGEKERLREETYVRVKGVVVEVTAKRFVKCRLGQCPVGHMTKPVKEKEKR